MYVCQKCNKKVPKKIKMQRIVLQRARYYPCGSVGSEITQEIPVCSSCLNEYKEKTNDSVAL
jgi:hypothetical protein